MTLAPHLVVCAGDGLFWCGPSTVAANWRREFAWRSSWWTSSPHGATLFTADQAVAMLLVMGEDVGRYGVEVVARMAAIEGTA